MALLVLCKESLAKNHMFIGLYDDSCISDLLKAQFGQFLGRVKHGEVDRHNVCPGDGELLQH